jgi:hypothetical protein
MDVDNDVRQLVLKNSSAGEIADVARKNGLRTLSEDGWRLVRLGITTPEEVLRVTKDQALNNVAPEAEPKPTIEVHAPKKSHAAV